MSGPYNFWVTRATSSKKVAILKVAEPKSGRMIVLSIGTIVGYERIDGEFTAQYILQLTTGSTQQFFVPMAEAENIRAILDLWLYKSEVLYPDTGKTEKFAHG